MWKTIQQIFWTHTHTHTHTHTRARVRAPLPQKQECSNTPYTNQCWAKAFALCTPKVYLHLSRFEYTVASTHFSKKYDFSSLEHLQQISGHVKAEGVIMRKIHTCMRWFNKTQTTQIQSKSSAYSLPFTEPPPGLRYARLNMSICRFSDRRELYELDRTEERQGITTYSSNKQHKKNRFDLSSTARQEQVW